jgi:hypothetical protein
MDDGAPLPHTPVALIVEDQLELLKSRRRLFDV